MYRVEALSLSSKAVQALCVYPFTWAVGGLIGITHLGFQWWFQPSPGMQAVAWAIDAGAMCLWLLLAVKSDAFLTFYNRRPYTIARKRLQNIVVNCPPEFRLPALACLELAHTVHREFTAAAYRHELDVLCENLAYLAETHRTLHARAQHFGTAEQQAAMQALLSKQVTSIQQTLATLQAFSGNLTLLSAQTAPSEMAMRELHFINQGLEEVIQEFHNAQT